MNRIKKILIVAGLLLVIFAVVTNGQIEQQKFNYNVLKNTQLQKIEKLQQEKTRVQNELNEINAEIEQAQTSLEYIEKNWRPN